MTRRGSAVFTMSVLCVIAGGLSVAMAVGAQADAARKAFQAHTTGRCAVEMAESALDECLAEFPRTVAAQLGPGEKLTWMRQRLVAGGGEVSGAEVLGVPSISFTARRTGALLRELGLSLELSPVTIRPLVYTMVPNRGAVELEATVRFRSTGGQWLTRRVIRQHHFVLDAPRGERFRVHTVPIHTKVDRGEAAL